MPTGYTCDITNSTTFKDFAIKCSKAFGANIELRDLDLNAPIPEYKIDNYYENSYNDAVKDLNKFKSLSDAEIQSTIDKNHKNSIIYNKKCLAEKKALKVNYTRLLKEVKAWKPPSKDHQGLKDFMVQQLEDTIKFDCDFSYYENNINQAKPSLEDFKKDGIKLLEDLVKSRKKSWDEEVSRVKGRNKWNKDLRDSLLKAK
jgi:hypothetical protein